MMWRMDRLRRSLSLIAGPRRRQDHGHQRDRPEGMARAMPSRLRRSSSRPARPERSDASNREQRESTASDEAIASFMAEFERQRAERLFRTGTDQERRVAETLLRATGTSASELQSTENDAAIAALIAGSTQDSTAFSSEATLRPPRLEQQPQQQQQPSPTPAPSSGGGGAGSSTAPGSAAPPLGPEATAATAASRGEAGVRRIARSAAQQAFSTVVATPPTAAANPAASGPATVDSCADDAAIAAALAEAVDDQAFRPNTARNQPDSSPTARQETCITCLDQVADACFIPCGHINVCCRCAARVNPRKCPVCRMNFEHFVRTQRR